MLEEILVGCDPIGNACDRRLYYEVTGKRIRDSTAPHEDDDDSDSVMSDEWQDGIDHEFDPQE